MPRLRLGVDVGSSFTDVTAWDEVEGWFRVLKVPSVRQDPAAGVITGVERVLAEIDARPADIVTFVNGTTVAVNTVIERTGARVGLLVTRGFRDILELRRVRLEGAPSYEANKPEALVRRKHVREVGERVGPDGRVLAEIPWDDVTRGVGELVAEGIGAIAICFLHAYRAPQHEAAVKQWIRREYPDVYVCASHEVWPQQREYERCSVTVLNAYVGSTVRSYFETLAGGLQRFGVTAPLFSTKSNGGVMSVEAAGEAPIQTLLSGPASGVIAAAHIARLAGLERIVTLDIGGTSADVSIVPGEILYSTENTVGGFPVVLPSVDVTSVGAGGGSLLWVDETGSLRVGPQSAGSSPGPACYGFGGHDATITDCYVALGIIHEREFLGGSFPLHADLARDALAALGARLGISATEVAAAALDAATATTHAALLPLLAGHGVDQRDFALMAFGGAGPTHAFLLAREAGFDRVVVPPAPGALCALGCVLADFRADFVRTVYSNYDEAQALLGAAFEQLDAEAGAWLARERIESRDRLLMRSADIRYYGQSYELPVPLPGGSAQSAVDGLREAFEHVYERVYGYTQAGASLEVVNVRVQAVGMSRKPAWRAATPRLRGGPEPIARRAVLYGGEPDGVPVYRRDGLRVGDRVPGPAIITQYDTTVFVPSGFQVAVDSLLNLLGESVS